MPIIYIAGALLQGHTLPYEEGHKNWKKVADIKDKIMQKGWTVVLPHDSLFMWKHIQDTQGRDIPWRTWMIQDSGMLKVSQALFFASHSKGADIELKWALDNDKKVYYNVNDVPTVIPETCLMDNEYPLSEAYKIEEVEGNKDNQ